MSVMTAKELSERLRSNIERLCVNLFPHGKKIGREWCVGSLAGEEGQSLRICIEGSNSGLWADFAGDDKGDALDLFAKAKGCSVSQAMADARKWLGIAESVRSEPRKSYARPASKVVAAKPDNPAQVFLSRERKIPLHIQNRYRISGDGSAMVFPSYGPDGKDLLQVKRIKLERRDGKKLVSTEKGCPPCLFGWQAIGDRDRSVIITEGEIDAMSWALYDFPAMSVPFGAGNLDWLEFEFENLSRFDEIILSFDGDDAGQKNVTEIMRRLGMHRCKNVTLPHKDMNEWLMTDPPSLEDIEVILSEAYVMHPVQFVSVSNYIDETYKAVIGERSGTRTSVFRDVLRFRDSETTLWTGTSGHGKSTFLSQLCLEFAAKGERVAVASMEMPIPQQIKKLAFQYWCKNDVSREEVMQLIRFLEGRYFPLDVYGMVGVKEMLELMEYSVRRYGCRHIVIDSIMKLDVPGDDYDAQRIAMNAITTFAHSHGVHAHVVAHPRKGENDSKAVGLLDVKGSGDLINQPDNVVVVWRNKRKEQTNSIGDCERQGTGPDSRIIIEKQRSTGDLAEIDLDYSREAQQLVRSGDKVTEWHRWYIEGNTTK